jgi:regulation of enolase protein 1 (concanavalin A-like superfamily)
MKFLALTAFVLLGAVALAQFSGEPGNPASTPGAASEPVIPDGRPLSVETRIWRQGEPPVRIMPKDDGFCALSLVTGHFQGGGEMVKVYIGKDGWWYLGGQSRQEGVVGECIVVRYHADPAVPVTDGTSATATAWKTRDVATVGSCAETNGTFTVNGLGADIAYTVDGFRYVYQPVTGDCTVTARVLELQNTSAFAKAGVMIRASLAPDSANAAVVVTPLQGVQFVERTTARATAQQLARSSGFAPCWVRLVRGGDTITAYQSQDGVSWTADGAATIAIGSTAYVGLAVCSTDTGAVCQAQFDNVSVTAGDK